MTTKRAARKSPSQWQSLIQQQAHSGLSAAEFCKANAIGYVSFCKWRNRLQAKQESHQATVSESPFFNLNTLNTNTGWNIRLELGNGVQLVLSQD